MDNIIKLSHPNEFKLVITQVKKQILDECEKNGKTDKSLSQIWLLTTFIEDLVHKKQIKKGSKRVRVDLMEAFKIAHVHYDQESVKSLKLKFEEILKPKFGIEVKTEFYNGYINFNLPQS